MATKYRLYDPCHEDEAQCLGFEFAPQQNGTVAIKALYAFSEYETAPRIVSAGEARSQYRKLLAQGFTLRAEKSAHPTKITAIPIATYPGCSELRHFVEVQTFDGLWHDVGNYETQVDAQLVADATVILGNRWRLCVESLPARMRA